ncbi:Bug family tripartite tricarboxylate transporter substrate binding protein [Hydrogenophaga sp.]|jgi:tripartite-type tricarboxylate transporter receptor subunit TctC|uniref:Bug family tripartite tricarboxylate transporter substrate binding protein n=1 Tax=Hydrogenophaga sp. TaxID=1904254 RepID=UPI003F704524
MNHPINRRLASAGILTAIATLAMPAHANTFPKDTIRIVVPYPPGGASDVTARILAEKMQGALKVSVIVENRPGANGNIAADAVARSPADGYTLLMANVGPNAISQSIYPKLSYDTVKSFAAVTQTTLVPIVLVTGPGMPARNMQELLAELKANPGKHTYASAGNGSSNHLTGALFASMAGVDALHVPYRGDGPALMDVVSGRVSMMFTTIVAAMPHIKNGRVKALGIATNQRIPALEGVPTIAESGLAGFDSASWGGIVAPAGTPAPIVNVLNKTLVDILNQADVKTRLAELGAVVVASTPDQFATYIRTETEKWGQVAKANKIMAD